MMTINKRSPLNVVIPAALAFALGCSAGVDDGSVDGSIEPGDRPADDGVDDGDVGLYPVQLTTAAERSQRWAQLLADVDGREAGAAVALSDTEEQSVRALLTSRGVLAEAIVFEGANVWLGDTFLDARTMLAQLNRDADGVVMKGRALGQIVNGTLSGGVPGAPDLYATQIDERFSFFRPELSSGTGFPHVLVVPNNIPADIRQVFEDAVTAIGQAGNADCLDTDFLTIETVAELGQRSPIDIPPRVTTVRYEPDPCPHSPTRAAPLGCAQFPYERTVDIAVGGPDGTGGVSQTRMLTGGYVAIDSNQIVANTAAARADALSTITHELMHTLGLAHPQEDPFDPVFGTNVVKIDIPGTNGDESGFQSIMALRGTADRSQTLSADDQKVIRTLYQPSAERGCGYTNGFVVVSPAP